MSQPIQPDRSFEPTVVGHTGARVDIRERAAWAINGWLGVLVALVCAGATWWLVQHSHQLISIAPGVATVLILTSLVIVQPGQTSVVRFFGSYVGTVRGTGLTWILPLSDRRKVGRE